MKESNSPRKYVAPIALDLGATHTGVYRAIYPRGTAITEIPEKRGEVLKLSPDKYTFLMRDRTAKRHMRRCIDRKKLAKRLLNVVLRDYFGFPAEEHDQALGFLLNRRGYTRLEETLHLDALDDFPDEAWQALPKKVRELLGDSKDKLKAAFEQLLSDNQEGLIQLYQALIQNTITFIKEKQEAQSAAKRLIEILKGADKPLKIGNKSISNTHIRILTEKGADSLDQINPLSKKELEGLNPSQKEKLIGELELAIKALEEDLKQFAKEVDISPQAVAMLGKVKGNFEWEKDGLKIQSGDAAAHLDHLTTGLIKAHEEITSGGRHRRKYFEEIKKDLERAINSIRENTNSQQGTRPETGKEPVHGYMRRFAEALEKHDRLDGEKIYQILAHIANLELKPLRAYFNDPRHKGADKWLPEEFNKIIPRWFLKNWRVSEQKDGLEKVRNYQKLKQAWEQHKQTASQNTPDAVEFWLKTDPELTIPPYQSHTNRRPPHCQSLVLNTAYMDEHYSQWKTWLSLLDTTAAPDLSGLKNRYGSKPLLQEHELNRRRLQFLLDRTKSLDPYRLNAIWSRHHQRQKYPEDSPEYLQADEKLSEEIKKSQLPDELKHDLDFNAEGSFGHFINKYYNSRRKARDSRIFIHPLTKPAVKALNKEHSEKLKRNPRWNDKNHLLTLCPHRPRQKQHQMLSDIAAVLGLTTGQLEQKLDDTGFDSVEQLLLSVHGLKTTAEQAALAQKKFKGQLKNLLQRGKQLLKQEKKPSREQNELIQLEQKCKQKAQLLAERLWPELPKEEQAAKASRFRSIHSFAQIYNLVFKDRSGFSSTCPACSTDNAGRMVENKDGTARASRLPALSIRLIDGAVRKMAEYLAHHLAERHWQLIKEPLFNGEKVCVPLILEQNRFEFEPNLRKIKGGNIPSKLKNEMEKQEQQLIESYQRKQQRIKESAGGICAYTGDSLADNGEIDHIIPRSSGYGTLNDEANLIYVSERGNKLKGNRIFLLADLNDRYKQHQFEGKTDKEIKQWIWQTLTGQPPHENPSFVFGRYLNFDNLSKDQQTAFRHALFLDSSDSLRQKVLEAIQNRNRTFVNGTQRFVAQVIADKLHQMAERNGKESQLEFDYFEYPADPNHPKGVQNLRRQIAEVDPELEKHEKQEDYSHHIDAHMAFLLAADEHRNDGSMGLRFEENPEKGYEQTVWPKLNGGELDPWLKTKLEPFEVEPSQLERKASKTGNRPHRPYHRENYYAQKYFPLWFLRQERGYEIRYGFDEENSVPLGKLSTATKKTIFKTLQLFSAESDFTEVLNNMSSLDDFVKEILVKKDTEAFYLAWDKNKINEFASSRFATSKLAKGLAYPKPLEWLINTVSYQTRKQAISSPEDIEKGLKEAVKTTKKHAIALPVKQEWQRLKNRWLHEKESANDEFSEFIAEYFLKNRQKHGSHQKVRKVFSLSVFSDNAHYLQTRWSHTGEVVKQLVADSDSRKDGNKFTRFVLAPNDELVEVVNKPFRSNNIFKLKAGKVYSGKDYLEIDPNRWYPVLEEDLTSDFESLPLGVLKLEYKVDNVTRPKVKAHIIFDGTVDPDKVKEALLKSPLTKPKEPKKLAQKDYSKLTGKYIEGPYPVSGFNKGLQKLLAQVIKRLENS